MDGEPFFTSEDRIRHDLPDLTKEQIGDLARIVDCLVAAFHPDSVYVFGSHARGEAGPESDVDLLIVIPSAKQPAYRLAQAAYRALPSHSISVDMVVMPRDEFERRRRALASLPATVLREGRIVYAA